MDSVQVQVRFTVKQDGLEYSDALYFSLEDYKNTDKKVIEQQKQERFDNFKQSIVDAQNAPEKSDQEQLLDLVDAETSLKEQLARISEQKTEFEMKVRPPTKKGG